ncbi:hypothetical protein [Mucilaginibacter sp. NFX135]|uniref:hypothetical protein n=1 Tax=Mucilaginibacter sp. NFX135 TaxID=3402687 RepID=UPI003AFA8D5F
MPEEKLVNERVYMTSSGRSLTIALLALLFTQTQLGLADCSWGNHHTNRPPKRAFELSA